MNRLEITIEYRGTVFDVRHLAEGEVFAVGQGADVDLPLIHETFGDRWPLAVVKDGVPRLRLPGPLPASTFTDGAVAELAPIERVRGLSLPPGGRARLAAGEVNFYFACVQAPPKVARRGLGALVGGDWRSFAMAAGLHALLLIVASAVPVDASSLHLDRLSDRPEFVGTLFKPQVEKPAESLFDGMNDAPAETEPGAGDDADAVSEAPPSAPAVRPTPQPKLSRAAAKTVAKKTAAMVARGIDDALGDTLDAPVLGGLAAGAMNAMNGTPDGTQLGMVGDPFGMDGGDPLGVPGGRPGPSAGITGLDRRGFRHVRDGKPAKSRIGPRRPRGPKAPPVVAIAQDPEFKGSLEKSEIRRVIRRHRAEYRYCYEKALNAKRDLNGKIVVKFVIGPTGAVTMARVVESNMGDASVGQCVARRVKRWAFPAPRDNGVVVVRYPFLFKPSRG